MAEIFSDTAEQGLIHKNCVLSFDDIDFKPKSTSTQIIKSPKISKKKASKRKSAINDSKDLSSYWKCTKRNKLGINSMTDKTLTEPGFEVVWADEILTEKITIINLKPKPCLTKDTPKTDLKQDELQIEKMDIVLNNLLSSLMIENKEKPDKLLRNNVLSQELSNCPKSEPNNFNSISENLHEESNSNVVANSINVSFHQKENFNANYDKIKNENSHLADAYFDEDDDWLSQIPDELFFSPNRFICKEPEGVVSEALLKPKENIQIPHMPPIKYDEEQLSSIEKENKNENEITKLSKPLTKSHLKRPSLYEIKNKINNQPLENQVMLPVKYETTDYFSNESNIDSFEFDNEGDELIQMMQLDSLICSYHTKQNSDDVKDESFEWDEEGDIICSNLILPTI